MYIYYVYIYINIFIYIYIYIYIYICGQLPPATRPPPATHKMVQWHCAKGAARQHALGWPPQEGARQGEYRVLFDTLFNKYAFFDIYIYISNN